MNEGIALLATDLAELLDLASDHLAPQALAAARLIPIVWLAPTFGGRLLPAPARIVLALGLALVLSPGSGDTGHPDGIELLAHLAVEALIGTALGLLASIPFELARASGHLVDVTRGASLAEVIAPGLQDRTSPTGDVLYLTVLVAVTAAGGDRLLILALADGFSALPPGSILPCEATADMKAGVLEASRGLIATALMLAAPPLIVALLADLVLGVTGRVAPQLPLFFLGMPVKTVLGLLVVAFALGPMLSTLLTIGAETSHLIADSFQRMGASIL